MTLWRRYVALGDPFAAHADAVDEATREPWLDWADRLASILDGNARLRGEQCEFTKIEMTGPSIPELVDDHVSRALDLKPDLVSILFGPQHLVREYSKPEQLASELENGVKALRQAGSDVLLATSFDPRFASASIPARLRSALFNAHLWRIARNHGTFTLDLWGMHELHSEAMWTNGRANLSSAGHRLLAARAAHVLGVAYIEVGGPTAAIEYRR